MRLFGPNAAVALADRLLDDFQKMCMERLVTCPNSTSLNLDILNEMAQAVLSQSALQNSTRDSASCSASCGIL